MSLITKQLYLISSALVLIFLIVGCREVADLTLDLSFTSSCPDEENPACTWHIAYQFESTISTDAIDETGGAELTMINGEGVGYVVRDVSVAPTTGQQVASLTASISASQLTGKGAGMALTVLSADSLPMQYADMGYGDINYVKGSSNGKRTISIVVPEGAATIRAGLITYGPGKATFSKVILKTSIVSDENISQLARDYVDAALDTIVFHSLMRDSLDVPRLRKQAYRIAGNAESPEDAHLAVRFLLGELRDHHSFLMTNTERKIWQGDDDAESVPTIKYATGVKTGDLGHLQIPGFHTNANHLKMAFADSLREVISQLTAQGVKGWIVDLRSNDGGNMYPMLAGLQPLFNADTLGSLVDVHGQREYWGRGEAFARGQDEDYLVLNRSPPVKSELPVAVLYGNQTGSSGEIVLLSFVGNTNTRSFGQPSFGLTTGNGNFLLPDSSYIFLASTRMADRNGRTYTGSVIPDEVTGEASETSDPALAAAQEWLRSKLY